MLNNLLERRMGDDKVNDYWRDFRFGAVIHPAICIHDIRIRYSRRI